MTSRKNVIAILLLAALGIGTWLVLRPVGEAPGKPGAAGGGPGGFAIPVVTAQVQVDTVVRSAQVVGSLRGNESVVVRPEMGGRIEKIHFTEGQPVKLGDPLFTLEASIYEAELEQAEARLNLSRTDSQRINSLRKQGLGTEQELDQSSAELRVTQAAMILARARLAKMTITAPFDGVIGLRQVSVGDYVSAGDDMVDLLNLNPIKVDFRVPEIYLPEVATGQAIEVQVDAFPGENFRGEVYAIDPQVDISGRSLVLRARIDNSDRRLQAGLFARVNLILARHDNALLIPEDALTPQGDRQFVFRVVDGKAVLTQIGIGQRRGTQVEVTEGLAATDVVVTAGQLKIRDGAPVSPLPPAGG